VTAVVNPSFELPGSGPGEAQGWTLTSVATVEQWAAFGERAAEEFDEWDGTDAAIFAFAKSNLQAAVFGPANKEQESFDVGWGNDTFLLDLASTPTEAAEFDAGTPLQVDSFIDWLAGGAWAASWDDVTGQAAPTEDFEQGWNGNEAAVFDWSGVTSEAAQFDTTPEGVEDFEEEFSTLVMTTI
jgi:hypothetical protein